MSVTGQLACRQISLTLSVRIDADSKVSCTMHEDLYIRLAGAICELAGIFVVLQDVRERRRIFGLQPILKALTMYLRRPLREADVDVPLKGQMMIADKGDFVSIGVAANESDHDRLIRHERELDDLRTLAKTTYQGITTERTARERSLHHEQVARQGLADTLRRVHTESMFQELAGLGLLVLGVILTTFSEEVLWLWRASN